MKGAMLQQFPVGTLVEFSVKSQRKHGRVVKLYRSCSFGAAKIKPTDGSNTVTRRLLNVWKPK